jgi:hypothetical protein
MMFFILFIDLALIPTYALSQLMNQQIKEGYLIRCLDFFKGLNSHESSN